MSGQASWETVLGEAEGQTDGGGEGSPDVTNISSSSEASPVLVEDARAALGAAKLDDERRQGVSLPPPPPQ
eukprot:3892967-Rhodomonas_salina.1